jgi:hypothetical protein
MKTLSPFTQHIVAVVEDASRPRQRAADFIRRLLGAKRLTTSGFSRLGLRQTPFASSLAPDP